MIDQNKKEEEIKVPSPEKEVSAQEKPASFEQEKVREARENLKAEETVSRELRREIELMNIDDNLRKEAEQKANKIQFLADDDKLKNLLEVAKQKGVIFAIKVAKSMNDPFILDTLHDALAQEGYYKDFSKK